MSIEFGPAYASLNDESFVPKYRACCNCGSVRCEVRTDPVDAIAAILDAVDRKIDLHRAKRGVLEELLRGLLHKLMTGEIHVNQLDLSTLDMQPSTEGVAA
jgi:hypothetical protein